MNTIVKLLQKKNSKTSNNNQQTKKITHNYEVKSIVNDLKKGISKENLIRIKNAKEPTWIALSSWSECSKLCGKGKSFLQRICIVPKNSKEHCEGDRIITKDCNLNPCENDENYHKGNFTNLENKIFDNIENPQKYQPCKIKEGDLALYINDGYLKGTKIPVRIILNKNTLTVYSSDNSKSIIVSHKLSDVIGLKEFFIDKSQKCFEIEEKTKKTILCAFSTLKSNLEIIAKDWQKDILNFIKNCSEFHSPKVKLFLKYLREQLDIKENNLVNTLNIQNSLDFYKTTENEETEKIILRTQQLALHALEKELKAENLLEKEEEDKEKVLDDEFEKQYEKIKSQKELINQALDQKKKQADIYANKLIVKKKIIQISETVKKQVEKIREDLKARLLSKKKDVSRKRELIKNKIENLKKDISKDLIKASKKGDFEECDPERKQIQLINYCKVNYNNEAFKLGECLKPDNFCYMCCEAEYGDLHLELRNNCYSKCNDFYFFKKKFKHTKVLNSYNNIVGKKEDVKKDYLKNEDIKKVNLKNKEIKKDIVKKEDVKNDVGNVRNNSKKDEVKNINEKEVLKSKFLQKNLNVWEISENLKNGEEKSISDLIEETKKIELLMNIKKDLNFDE